jgi:ribonuclease P protein component
VQRLKTRSQFQAVLAGGTVARTVHFALHRAGLVLAGAESGADGATKPVDPAEARLCDVAMGAMVPKRWAKRAVTRNTIKRQIYSVGAEFESILSLAAHVVRLRASFDKTQFPSATSDMLKTTVRCELQQLFTNAAVRRPGSVQDARP